MAVSGNGECIKVSEPLVEIKDLVTEFPGSQGPLLAVDGVDLQIKPGEILGLVGESGCGKTITALSIMGLVPPPGKVSGGSVRFKGEELRSASPERLRKLRGEEVSMIFQEPMTSLNPVFTIERQLTELVMTHGRGSRKTAIDMAVAMLERVGIPEAQKRLKDYPHQFSGGMRQRVMIAMALLLDPSLVIADEPTTALDVTIQAQILKLMQRLQQEMGASILLITHNLAVVAQVAGRVAVMYTGRMVEKSTVSGLFANPLHPYSKGLLSCLPSRADIRGGKLRTIPGVVPPLDSLPKGCAFSDRCPEVMDKCREREPGLVEVAPGHLVRCYLHHDLARKTGPNNQRRVEAA
jgi:peptide/nickel transport system ATP-binding protein